MTSRARTPAGLLGLFVCLVVVAAAVTALPPAAGAATPLQRSSRSASSSAADNPSPAATLVVVIAGTARPVIRSARPHLPSSAAESRSPRHAFRAAPFAGHPTVLFVLLVVPARGPRAPSCAPAARDRFAVAGGDPVNGSDPTGLKGGGHPPGIECGKYGEGSPGWDNCVHQLEHPDYSYIGSGCWGLTSWWNCFVMEVDPAYAILAGTAAAWNAAQDPCSSNWTIAGDSAEAALGVVGTVGAAVGITQLIPGLGGDLSVPSVATPYGPAIQDLSPAAVAARSQVQAGVLVYRLGATLKSDTANAQFWSLESPTAPGFAARYGLPPSNVANADFIEWGVLRQNTPFVTRLAPGIGSNPGGGVEVVVPPGGVQLLGFASIDSKVLTP